MKEPEAVYLGRTPASLFSYNEINASVFLFQILLPPENLSLPYRGGAVLA